MESDAATADPATKLSFDDVVRFFKAVCQPGNCPMCAAIAWQIPLTKPLDPVSLVASGLTFDGRPRLALQVSCNNCGYYRSHDTAVILEWLAKNPKDFGGAHE